MLEIFRKPVEATPEADDVEIVDRPTPPLSKTDYIMAFAAALIFLVLYLVTSSLWTYPGDDARICSIVVGAIPSRIPNEWLLRTLYGAVTTLVPKAQSIHAVSCMNALIAALSVGFFSLMVNQIFRIYFDPQRLKDLVPENDRIFTLYPRKAAFVATVAFALSVPFWISATRVNPNTLNTLLLFAAMFFATKFVIDERTASALLGSAIIGIACSQNGESFVWAILILLVILYGIICSEKQRASTFSLSALVMALTFVIFLYFTIATHIGSEGWHMDLCPPVSKVISNYAKALLSTLTALISRQGWLIPILMGVVPTAVWVIYGREFLNAEVNKLGNFMSVVLITSCVLVLGNSRFSPWRMLGLRPGDVIVYALSAATFAFAFLILRQQLLFAFEKPNAENAEPMPWDGITRFLNKFLRRSLTMIAAVLVLMEAVQSFRIANTGTTSFLRAFADATLDGLGERTLLMTDGQLDDIFRLRAYERNLPVRVLSFAEATSPYGQLALKEELKNANLRNALDSDVISFLREYIGTVPDAGSTLALTYFPDLWNLGEYRVYPLGLAFVGAPIGSPLDNPLGDAEGLENNYNTLTNTMQKIGGLLDAAESRIGAIDARVARSVRGRIGFIGNNLAYYFDQAGNANRALWLYRKVHTFAPDNLSALLNLHSKLQSLNETETEEFAMLESELALLRDGRRSPPQIWELSRSHGYVASPEAFAFLGWSWALSGQTPIAIKTLSSALKDAETGSRAPLLLSLGAISAKLGNAEESARYYTEAAQSSTNNATALFGLLRSKLALRDIDGASDAIANLEAIGIPERTLLKEKITVKINAGDVDGAKVLADKLLVIAPNEPESVLSYCCVQIATYSRTTNETTRARARQELETYAKRLRSNKKAGNGFGAIAMGTMYLLDRRFDQARDELLIANRTFPRTPILLELILKLDYGLADPTLAKEHAQELLRMNPDHGFANYVMGSLAIQSGRWKSARAYLERSARTWESPLPLGDLAYVEFRSGAYLKAEELAREGIARNPTIYEIWDTLGLALLATERHKEAIESFEHAIKIRPDAHVAHLHLAKARLDNGEGSAARSIIDHLERFAPTFHAENMELYNEIWSKTRIHAPLKDDSTGKE